MRAGIGQKLIRQASQVLLKFARPFYAIKKESA
jgi:hypothetical protein